MNNLESAYAKVQEINTKLDGARQESYKAHENLASYMQQQQMPDTLRIAITVAPVVIPSMLTMLALYVSRKKANGVEAKKVVIDESHNTEKLFKATDQIIPSDRQKKKKKKKSSKQHEGTHFQGRRRVKY